MEEFLKELSALCNKYGVYLNNGCDTQTCCALGVFRQECGPGHYRKEFGGDIHNIDFIYDADASSTFDGERVDLTGVPQG